MRSTMMLVGVAMVLSACGVPTEVYRARESELEKAQARLLTIESNSRSRCETEIAERQKAHEAEVGRLRAELTTAKASTVAAGAARAAMSSDVEALASKLEPLAKAGNLALERRADALVVRLPDGASFNAGETSLRGEARDLLVSITKALADARGPRVQVVAHAASNETPARATRLAGARELTMARSVEVANLLVRTGGLAAERVSAASFVGSATEKGDRHIELLVTGDPAGGGAIAPAASAARREPSVGAGTEKTPAAATSRSTPTPSPAATVGAKKGP